MGYKMKTNRSAAKRFKAKGNGKLKRKCAFLRHNMRKRSADAKRVLRKKTEVDISNESSIRDMLPYA